MKAFDKGRAGMWVLAGMVGSLSYNLFNANPAPWLDFALCLLAYGLLAWDREERAP